MSNAPYLFAIQKKVLHTTLSSDIRFPDLLGQQIFANWFSYDLLLRLLLLVLNGCETFAIQAICYLRHLLSETITIFYDSSDSISIIVFSCTTVYYIVVKVDIHLLCHFKISVEWYSISNYFSMIKLLFRVEVRPITYFNMEVFKVNFMYYVHTLLKFQSNLSKIPCDFANSKWDFESTKCQWIGPKDQNFPSTTERYSDDVIVTT